MASDSELTRIVGLDIGTSKVAAIVAELNPEGELEIIGLGSHPSRGLKKGVVVNIESTVQSIQRAVEEAELMAGCHIENVYAGIAGSHTTRALGLGQPRRGRGEARRLATRRGACGPPSSSARWMSAPSPASTRKPARLPSGESARSRTGPSQFAP